MNVLFASAEFAPLIRVGGLAEATAGLVSELRIQGVDVDVVLPDYFDTPLESETVVRLDVPRWAGKVVARSGVAPGAGLVTLVNGPGIRKTHPYVNTRGEAWPDNPDRFFAFSAAVAALVVERDPDLVHLNDWHTALTLAFLQADVPSVLTIHTLGYQGWTSGGWLDRLGDRSAHFDLNGGTNPMAGAIALADRLVAVSPNYADEIRRPETGAGLHELLKARGSDLVGIRNGIDTSIWDPETDQTIAARYSVDDMAGKAVSRTALLDEVGWAESDAPIVGVVSRLVEQKGIDFVLDVSRFARTMPIRLIMLGSGERWIAAEASSAASEQPESFVFRDGYDGDLAHRIFAGSDLFLMPSRFEPCGLAQMQAMAYGTIPVVTGVGGLKDTVRDADDDERHGTGFVSDRADTSGVVDALHRAVRAWYDPAERSAIQQRGMRSDWSWSHPAQAHIELYEQIT